MASTTGSTRSGSRSDRPADRCQHHGKKRSMALTKRQRAKVVRGVQYVALVLIVLTIALAADWGRIQSAFFDLEVARGMFPDVITVALKNTMIYTALGFVFGFAWGLMLALMRLSTVGVYRVLAGVFIEFFRGLPALLVILAVGSGFPMAFPGTSLNRYVAIMIALG